MFSPIYKLAESRSSPSRFTTQATYLGRAARLTKLSSLDVHPIPSHPIPNHRSGTISQLLPILLNFYLSFSRCVEEPSVVLPGGPKRLTWWGPARSTRKEELNYMDAQQLVVELFREVHD
jgi:hypothetical protein